MLVVYEINKNDIDEMNLFDCDTYKELKYFFDVKLKERISTQKLGKAVKNKSIVHKRYIIRNVKV